MLKLCIALLAVGAYAVTYKLESSDEIYWNVGDVATFKDGVRNNLNAKCTASSEHAIKTCPSAFTGVVGVHNYWSCDWNKEDPTYWLKWNAPASDTIKIYQAHHEHSCASLTFGDQVCQLNLGRVKQAYVTFKFADVCRTKGTETKYNPKTCKSSSTTDPKPAPTPAPAAAGDCKTTTCTYDASGHTHVYSKTLGNNGVKLAAPERWKCQKAGTGCACTCHNLFKCTLIHHHTSGYKRSFHHCKHDATATPTPKPTPAPTPKPTPAPTPKPTPAPTPKKTETKTSWKLESDTELYWNVADVATFKDGKRTNLHAPCTASSTYATRTCNKAFNGLHKHGTDYWSCDWNKEAPSYWLKWDSPASADTIKIFQAHHEHSRAKLTYGDQVCELNLRRTKGSYVTFKLADVCKTKGSTPAPTPTPKTKKYSWKLESDTELYWNVADVATFKDGKRNNLHAPCTASSTYATRTCNKAFNGLHKHGTDYWSCDWNKEAPSYWLKWDGPAADTIKIFQAHHEHSRAKVTFGDQVCELNLGRTKGRYVTFKLADVCKTKRR